MAQLGNNANLDAMVEALQAHIETSRVVLDHFLIAQHEQQALTVAKDAGSGHTDLEIETSVSKLITLADVASAQTTFNAAKDVFTNPDPIV